MGEVHDPFHIFREFLVFQFIEQDCQKDGYREGEQEVSQVQYDGILEGDKEARRREDPPEMLQSYPWAILETEKDIVILKSRTDAIYRGILEKPEIGKWDNQHDVQGDVSLESPSRQPRSFGVCCPSLLISHSKPA